MVGCHIGEEQLIGIADRTLQEADNDNDREITFDEFCKVLETSDIAQTLSIKFKDWSLLAGNGPYDSAIVINFTEKKWMTHYTTDKLH